MTQVLFSYHTEATTNITITTTITTTTTTSTINQGGPIRLWPLFHSFRGPTKGVKNQWISAYYLGCWFEFQSVQFLPFASLVDNIPNFHFHNVICCLVVPLYTGNLNSQCIPQHIKSLNSNVQFISSNKSSTMFKQPITMVALQIQ